MLRILYAKCRSLQEQLSKGNGFKPVNSVVWKKPVVYLFQALDLLTLLGSGGITGNLLIACVGLRIPPLLI